VEDEGKDVLLFMHSYAGMPGAAAATGLAKSQRTQDGKAGGVVGLLFLGAFVVAEGSSCAGLMGGNLPPWILVNQVGPSTARSNHCLTRSSHQRISISQMTLSPTLPRMLTRRWPSPW
jgi:hypothetical protein